MMWSCKYFPLVSKMPTLGYNEANNDIIKNAIIILDIIHNILNLRDIGVAICIILVLFKIDDGFNHHLDIKHLVVYKAIVIHNSETIYLHETNNHNP